MRRKASITVEAALLCPFLCLVLCGMILVTLQLYQRVDGYAKELVNQAKKGMSSSELIRLEAVTEEIW